MPTRQKESSAFTFLLISKLEGVKVVKPTSILIMYKAMCRRNLGKSGVLDIIINLLYLKRRFNNCIDNALAIKKKIKNKSSG